MAGVQMEMPIVQLLKVKLPIGGRFSGQTAGWLHRFNFAPCDPIEVTLPRTARTSRRVGLALTRSDLDEADVTEVHGLPVTSATRTVADLGRRLPLVESVVVVDAALHRGLVRLQQLEQWVDAHRGYRGIGRLRQALGFAEPATESPMETRLRMLLVLNRLPKPIVQSALYDDTGGFIARVDLYYPLARLAIEYDGASHRDSVAADNRRQNRILEAGYKLLRLSAGDLYNSPASVVGQVERAIR